MWESHIYLELCPKYIYLDSDLIIYYFDHFIMEDCLFALVLFKNYVETIMFGLDAVLRWGTFLDIMPTKQPLF